MSIEQAIEENSNANRRQRARQFVQLAILAFLGGMIGGALAQWFMGGH